MENAAQLRVDQAHRRQQDAERRRDMAQATSKKLIQSIQRDLKKIRQSCQQNCDCPGDIPGTDCPNNVMHRTMTTLVNIMIEAVTDAPTTEAKSSL